MTPVWPDAVNVFLDIVEPLVGSDKVVGRIPYDWDGDALVYAERIGGTDDGITTDTAVLSVACYGTTRAASLDLATRVRTAVLAAARTVVNGCLIYDTATVVGPQDIPDLDPDDRRQVSTYALDLARI